MPIWVLNFHFWRNCLSKVKIFRKHFPNQCQHRQTTWNRRDWIKIVITVLLLLTWIKILPHSQIVLDGKIFIVDIPKMDYFLFLFFFRIVTIKGHLCRLAKHNHQVEHDEEVKRILHWHFDNSLYTFKEVSFFRNTFYESVKKTFNDFLQVLCNDCLFVS